MSALQLWAGIEVCEIGFETPLSLFHPTAFEVRMLKSLKEKVRHYDLFDAAKKILLVVSVLLIVDVAVALLGTSYLSENIGTFIGKVTAAILSDLLFIEGSAVLATGIFVMVATLWREKPSSETAGDKSSSDEQQESDDKHLPVNILVLLIGAVMIALSITVGTLFV